MHRYLIRLLDDEAHLGDSLDEFRNHLYYNGYKSFIISTVPFVDIEVVNDECCEIESMLQDREINYVIY